MASSAVSEALTRFTAEVSKLSNERERGTGPHNIALRQLYSRIELFLLDLHEGKFAGFTGKIDDDLLNSTEAKCNDLKDALHLVPIHRPYRLWDWVDLVYRFTGVCAGVLTVGVFASLPMIALRVMDQWLELDAFAQWSERLKRAIAWYLLEVSGIHAEVVNNDVHAMRHKYFKEPCVLLTFSHSSNLDGFLVSATCPIRHFALAKKELFMIPFFSWISLAFGGVPVDRGNRERAVTALQRASAAAKGSQCTIVIAPEGTRSTTGQLLPFKKGTFHMWEQLRVPIVPVIFYGAYELYPVGSWVNNTGKVYVRYLDPIGPAEAPDREAMARLVRRRMLEAFVDTPGPIGADLHAWGRVRAFLATAGILALDAAVVVAMREVFLRRLGVSPGALTVGLFAAVVFITVALYVYNVYIVNAGGSQGGSAGKGKKQEKGG